MQKTHESHFARSSNRTNYAKPASIGAEGIRIVSSCGTLTDISDYVGGETPDEIMDARVDRMNTLISEILFLVDLLFAERNIPVIAPGDAA